MSIPYPRPATLAEHDANIGYRLSQPAESHWYNDDSVEVNTLTVHFVGQEVGFPESLDFPVDGVLFDKPTEVIAFLTEEGVRCGGLLESFEFHRDGVTRFRWDANRDVWAVNPDKIEVFYIARYRAIQDKMRDANKKAQEDYDNDLYELGQRLQRLQDKAEKECEDALEALNARYPQFAD
jgi:hypothetical protein